MFEILITFGQLALALLTIGGPLGFLLLLLAQRDRREKNIRTVVSRALNTPELRGLHSTTITGGLLQEDSVVVELWRCSREQVWEVILHLTAQLPPRVRLVINGVSDPVSRSALTLKIQRKPVAVCPAPCAF